MFGTPMSKAAKKMKQVETTFSLFSLKAPTP